MDHPDTPGSPTPGSTRSPSAAPVDHGGNGPGAHRLPRTVTPGRYQVRLEPDLDGAAFAGSVIIEADVVEPVVEIVLHAADLEVDEVSVRLRDGTVRAPGVRLEPDAERLHLELPTPIDPGPITIEIAFRGVLNDLLRGFYRSTFTDADGQTHTIASTQMEATDARRAFPCWDEPDRKAAFEVTLVVAEELEALSNGPVVSREPHGDGRDVVRFAPTMAMSTYLVAFVVGPLELTGPVDVDGVPVRVAHVPGKGQLASFALEVAEHALRFFTDYFDIPYPADKLDLVAIPDFAFGAMENLGCVTFRETALLVDPARAARTELERVADVVSHEIAHMWFGDLVTMRWWNGIWLNEAFATFMEVLCVDAFRPAWERWVSFGAEREMALAVDGLRSTRPVEYPVGPPSDAEGMFDILTYQKGGSVLRMLEQYLGPEVFRDGIRSYLRAHAHANTETSDLWDALESVSGEPVRTLMDSWILQGGHPLVRLDAKGQITQEPFSYLPPENGDRGAIGTSWRVPVLVRPIPIAGGPVLGEGRTARVLLDQDPAPAPDYGAGEELLLDAGGWGFYRTGYTSEHLGRLAPGLHRLGSLERANLLGDQWAQALAARAPLTDFFLLATGLGADLDPAPWNVVIGALGLVDRVVDEADRPQVASMVRRVLAAPAHQLGWDPAPGEGDRVPTLRGGLLRALGTIGVDEEVRSEARRRWQGVVSNAGAGGATRLDPDTAGAVLESVSAAARPEDFDAFVAASRAAATPQEELRFLHAMTTFPDRSLCIRAFEVATTEVRTQNAPYLVQSLLSNRTGGPAVWGLVEANWDDLLSRFPSNSIDRMIDGVRGLCGDRDAATGAIAFLRDHPVPSGQRSVEQTLERLEVQLAFADRARAEIAALADQVLNAQEH